MAHITSIDIHGNTYKVPPAELVWRPSAYGIVVHDNQILLTRQYEKFMLPGGGIEFGETPELAVVREIKEETGFDVRASRLAEVQTGYFSYEENNDMYHVQTLLMFYVCQFCGGEASIDGFTTEEKLVGDAPEWFDISELHKINAGASFDWRQVVKRAL